MPEKTVKCPICGKPYVIYAHMIGDQSACPACRMAERLAVSRLSNDEERERLRKHFE